MRLTLFFLLLFSIGLPAQNQSVNLVLGDSSWLATKGEWPNALALEKERITTHLNYVIKRLKKSAVADSLTAQRSHMIALLEQYAEQQQFPSNRAFPDERRPCFIDENGNICAVGYLVQQTAGADEARRINRKYQHEYIRNMKDEGLLAWQKNSGLSLRELEMIQPAYGSPGPARKTEVFQDSASGKWGVRDIRTGKVTTKAQYDEVRLGLTYGGMGMARKGKLWGLINEKGRAKSRFKYQQMAGGGAMDRYIVGIKDSLITIFNDNGKRLNRRGITQVGQYNAPYFFVKGKGGWGVLHEKGKFLIPTQYVEVDYHYGYFKIKTLNGYGLLDAKGKPLIPAEYEQLKPMQRYWVAQRGGENYLYNRQGELSELRGIEALVPYSKGGLLARVGNKYGLLRSVFKWAIEPDYDTIYPAIDHHVVEKNGLKGYYFSGNSRLILDVKYKYIGPSGKSFVVQNAEGKMGVKDENGDDVLPVVHDTVLRLVSNRSGGNYYCYGVADRGAWSVYSSTGKLISTEIYDHARVINRHLFTLRKQGQYYLAYYYHDTLTVFREHPFDSLITVYSHGMDLFVYRKDGKYGFVKMQSGYNTPRYATEAIFDEWLDLPGSSSYVVKQGNQYGLVGYNGELLVPVRFSDYRIPKSGGAGGRLQLLLQDASGWYRVYRDGRLELLE